MNHKIEVKVPALGNVQKVDVIEVLVKPGDNITQETSIITLESDKASMEIPSPEEGVVHQVYVKVGDQVSEGDLILQISRAEKEQTLLAPQASPVPKKVELTPEHAVTPIHTTHTETLYAGPMARRLARELGVSLPDVSGTGHKGRISKEDVESHVSAALGSSIANMPQPAIDFSIWGDVDIQPLSKIKRLTGVHVHRSWVTVPHVTQFDEADITELENFRKQNTLITEHAGYKLTLLAFIIKASVKALQTFPQFNASLDPLGNLVYKKYYHIGVAVDTKHGLVVPVLQNAESKGIIAIAKELSEISQKAREKGLTPKEMEGSSFTISSLGGVGGTAFTPIINLPNVAILGVSRAKIQPVYLNGAFVPRLILPMALSYDHRAIDGVEAARFTTYLSTCLNDLRNILL